jgi:hypothetical protein
VRPKCEIRVVCSQKRRACAQTLVKDANRLMRTSRQHKVRAQPTHLARVPHRDLDRRRRARPRLEHGQEVSNYFKVRRFLDCAKSNERRRRDMLNQIVQSVGISLIDDTVVVNKRDDVSVGHLHAYITRRRNPARVGAQVRDRLEWPHVPIAARTRRRRLAGRHGRAWE